MKRVMLIALAGLLATAPSVADIHLEETTRNESAFLGFATRAKQGPMHELWIGHRRAALTQDGHTLIIDLEKSWFCFVNHRAETYVEMTLPLDLSAVYSEELKSAGLPRKTAGAVRETDESRRLLDKRCTEYEVSMWNAGEDPSEGRVFRVWATTDVSFDWSVVDELIANMRVLYNRGPKLRAELAKIRGIQMGLEWESGGFPFSRRYVTEMIRISEKQPPPGTYLPPEGYSKKERLTRSDF